MNLLDHACKGILLDFEICILYHLNILIAEITPLDVVNVWEYKYRQQFQLDSIRVEQYNDIYLLITNSKFYYQLWQAFVFTNQIP